ncbi:hypothetical protein G5V57_20930 [Nordella sp. HKS 07]|uniref:hypothetical protein n=1 Tax=Nordella sp. HKS 07 TaxID=2712222 RepID=UPI0013E18EFF|nr:hypothetical protein [Nordella sp. HKS 07]QIG49970.1 hypothetical protein G5V57_20930 [Nordella sp. HKS 07]
MNKIQTVVSAEYANDAVKETAGRVTAETRRESVRRIPGLVLETPELVRKTRGLWAGSRDALGGFIETLRGR